MLVMSFKVLRHAACGNCRQGGCACENTRTSGVRAFLRARAARAGVVSYWTAPVRECRYTVPVTSRPTVRSRQRDRGALRVDGTSPAMRARVTGRRKAAAPLKRRHPPEGAARQVTSPHDSSRIPARHEAAVGASPSFDGDAGLERIKGLEEQLAPARANSRLHRELTEAIRIEADAYRKSLDVEQATATHDARPCFSMQTAVRLGRLVNSSL